MTPRVSLVLPFRDPGRFFPAAVACVRRQTFRDLEIVAIDDRSADGSREWLEGIDDPRIRVVEGRSEGLVAALNLGARLAHGEFLARMDADDLCGPRRIAEQVAFLDAHPDHVLVGSRFAAIDEDDRPLYAVAVPCEDGEIRSGLRGGNRFQHGSVTMRRAAFVAAGGYRPEMALVEDYDLWTRLAERGRVANLPAVLYWWRVHPGGVSLRNFAAQEAMAGLVRRCAQARSAGRSEPIEQASEILAGDGARLRPRRARARLDRWRARCERLRGNRSAAARAYLRSALRCPWDPYLFEEILFDVLGGRDRRRQACVPLPPRFERDARSPSGRAKPSRREGPTVAAVRPSAEN